MAIIKKSEHTFTTIEQAIAWAKTAEVDLGNISNIKKGADWANLMDFYFDYKEPSEVVSDIKQYKIDINNIKNQLGDQTVAEQIAAIVADAPEDLDTLKEISDWITSHADSAATMNSQIVSNSKNIADINRAISEHAVIIPNHTDRILSIENEVSNARTGGFNTTQQYSSLAQRLNADFNACATKTDLTTSAANLSLSIDNANSLLKKQISEKTGIDFSNKNLIVPDLVYPITKNGITATREQNGCITLSGTSTSTEPTIFYVGKVYVEKDKTYIITGCPAGSENGYQVDLRNNGATVSGTIDTGYGITFDCTNTAALDYTIRIAAKVTLNNVVFEPMVRASSVSDGTYVSYMTSLYNQLDNLADKIAKMESSTLVSVQ